MSRSPEISVSLVALTPSEVDFLAHLFYSTTCGRVETSDELRALFGRAEIALPESIQELLFSFFGGADGVVCQEFLDMARIVKSLQRATDHRRLLLSRQDAVAEEEAAECSDLFHRLAWRRDIDQQLEQASTSSTAEPHAAVRAFSATTRVPTSVRELIHSRRQQLEQRGVSAAAEQTAADVELPALSAEERQTLQLLRKYDSALSSDAPPKAASPSSSPSAAFAPPAVADDEGDAEHNEVKVQRALECCFAAMHNSQGASPGTRGSDEPGQTVGLGGDSQAQRILHLQLRQELHEFGLVSDAQWDAPRSLASIGVDDDSVGDIGETGTSVWLYADPINYVPLSQQQLIELLRHGTRSRPLRDEVRTPRDDELDGEDRLDGLEHILDELRRAGRRSHGRSRDETDIDDDSSDRKSGVGDDDLQAGRLSPVDSHVARGAVSPQDTHALATVERDLFVSATRSRLLDEIKVFVEGQQKRTMNETQDAPVPNPIYRRQPSSSGLVAPNHSAKDPLGGTALQQHQRPASPATATNVDPFQAPQISARERMSNPSTSRGEGDHPPLETERRQPNGGGTPSSGLPNASHVLTKQRFHPDSKSSNSSATGKEKEHVLHHKLRQLLSRRLTHQLHHMVQNNFPVSRKSLSVQTGASSISSSVDTRPVFRTPPSLVSIASPDLPATRDSAEAHRQRVAYAAMEAQFQREVLDTSFPACDMSYQDIVFTPKLSRMPLGTPLFLTCKTSRAPPPSVVPSQHRDSVQVVPGILNDSQHSRCDVGYRTRASRCGSRIAMDETDRHHFLRPKSSSKATPVWARRLSVTPANHTVSSTTSVVDNGVLDTPTSVSPKRRHVRPRSSTQSEKHNNSSASAAPATRTPIHGADAARCFRRALSRALHELRSEV